MALQKSTKNINFGMGLDTKTDPLQVEAGKFLVLENTVFDKGGLLQKRNGYEPLTIIPNSTSTFITTFNENLVAIGTTLQAFSPGTESWVDKGSVEPVQLDTLSLIRNNTNQSQSDTAISSNGLICTVYTDNIPSGSTTAPVYKYSIASATTGQNIVAPTVITAILGTVEGNLRVVTFGRYFVILFTVNVAGTHSIEYIAIDASYPDVVYAKHTLAYQYVPSAAGSYDVVVTGPFLYMAWSGADAVRVIYMNDQLQHSNPLVYLGRTATEMSVTADNSVTNPIVYASFYDSNSQTGYTLAVHVVGSFLTALLAPTQTISAENVANITATAINGVCTIYYEVNNSYGYDSAVPTNYIKQRTITQSGSLGVASILIRSVGLASKAFLINSMPYFLAIYYSLFQPTYFLINRLGKVIAKLAYSNGGTYLTSGLPGVTVAGNVAQVSYLIRDLIQSVNKTQGLANAAGIYSQTGINLASFTLTSYVSASVEIGSNLNMQGGLLWNYDGYSIVENGFFLWPDNVEASFVNTGGQMTAQKYFYVATYEWADNQGNVFRSAPSIPIEVDMSDAAPSAITFQSVFAKGDTSITVSSAAGLLVGQVLSDNTTGANISVGTFITSINGTTIGLSQPTAAGSTTSPGDTLQTVTVCTATVNVPTIRLTHKTNNPVKLVLYRWSVAQQIYYQTTSTTIPVLNDTSVDYIAITDKNNDFQILGNNILYTTGGVLENISPPASKTLALFNSRVFLVDAEDQNLLLYSKQVIESTPVEMSDLLSIYVAPTLSAQGSTGTMTALSSLDDKLIIFKRDAMYYINGVGPDNTGANSQYSDPVFITATVGCTNQQSIVFTPQGLIFQSDKGMWLLGRDLSTSYIGAAVEAYTTNALVQSAVNVPSTNQVRFTLDSGITLMYDYYYGQWGTFVNVPAISSTLYGKLHTYLDSEGRIFREKIGAYLDNGNPVLINFTTSWFNLAGLQGYERAYFFYILATYVSPHKLNVQISYDYNPNPTQSSIITPTNFNPNWGGLAQWGSSPNWGGHAAREQWRVFLRQQKCQAFQISITEVYDESKFINSLEVPPGAGFTMSGLALVLGMKSGYPRLKASKSVG